MEPKPCEAPRKRRSAFNRELAVRRPFQFSFDKRPNGITTVRPSNKVARQSHRFTRHSVRRTQFFFGFRLHFLDRAPPDISRPREVFGFGISVLGFSLFNASKSHMRPMRRPICRANCFRSSFVFASAAACPDLSMQSPFQKEEVKERRLAAPDRAAAIKDRSGELSFPIT